MMDNPVLHPTEAEFNEGPVNYIEKVLIPGKYHRFGVVAIKPPPTWQPRQDMAYSDIFDKPESLKCLRSQAIAHTVLEDATVMKKDSVYQFSTTNLREYTGNEKR